jgi:hypothetical protein
MNFIVGQTGNIYDSITSVIIQDGDDTVSNIQLPSQEDTIAGWHALLILLHNTNPDELNNLLAAIPQLLETEIDDDAHSTYLHMLHASFEWLEEKQQQTLNASELQALQKLYKQLECALFHFKVDGPHNGFYEAVFSHPSEEPLTIKIPSDKFDKSPVQASQAMLAVAYETHPEPIEHFVDDYIHFQAHIVKDDPKTFIVFFCLSKALIRLIKQETARLGMYISRVPDICTFIVKNELDNEEQKTYLELILNSLEHIEQRLERLNGIIKDIQNAYSKQQKEDEQRRLMHVISVISHHYLMLYDFSRSANFWKKVKSKDLLLWFFLAFHRRPLLYLTGQFLLLSIPTFFALQHWACEKSCPPSANGPLMVNLSDLALSDLAFLILLWYAVCLLLLSLILVQIMRKRWLYSQLLLPRFLGAAIVGLVPLVLNDQSWLIGIQSSVISWLLVVLFFYIISFIFMYIDVSNILKFIPGRSMTDILRVSSHIFGIAFSETLFIVTIASTLIFPTILPSLKNMIGEDKFGISISLGPWLSLGFFPALILLWTGIALFIGSFVQLWGQGQRITEPI